MGVPYPLPYYTWKYIYIYIFKNILMSTHKSFLSDQTDWNISYKHSMSAHFFQFFQQVMSITLYLKINNKLFKKYSYEWSDSPLWAIKHVKIFLMSTHKSVLSTHEC